MRALEAEHPADAARAADRAYFEAHPTARSYQRSFIPGEVLLPELLEAPPVCVVVARVWPGWYLKAAVYDRSDVRTVRLDLEGQAATLRGEVSSQRGRA